MNNEEKTKVTEEIDNIEAETDSADIDETEDAAIDEIEELKKTVDEYKDKLLRLTAEFDNFRKRTSKEKETLFSDGMAECATQFLPLVDNMARCTEAFNGESEDSPLKKGVELIAKQLDEIVKALNIEEIPAVGEEFDPNFHNAVMHVEDETIDTSTITEEFQKGYTMSGRVLRYSMVKVAN